VRTGIARHVLVVISPGTGDGCPNGCGGRFGRDNSPRKGLAFAPGNPLESKEINAVPVTGGVPGVCDEKLTKS
jgi:hypothetical protein